MTDMRMVRNCPFYGENINSINKPCSKCAFYDVDYKKCRIIRTDENLQLLLHYLKQR